MKRLLALIIKLIYSFRKEQIIVKKLEVKEEVIDFKDESPVVIKVEMKNTALSVVKDPKTGWFHLVRVKFDINTLTAGEVTKLSEGSDRMLALEKFKIESANTFFRSES